MRRSMIISVWILCAFIVSAFLGSVVFITFLTVTNYHPEPVEKLEIRGNDCRDVSLTTEFSLMTWNIGYAGLGKEMDFFYEGGKRVRPGTEEFQKYLHGIIETIKQHDSIDFLFIQEVDIRSGRSYYLDQSSALSAILPVHCFAFAKNYDCRYVPVPVYNPMAKVVSGILSFSRFMPDSTSRIDFGTKFSWPKNLVFLKRCFIVMRFHLGHKQELVLINTHNSVFDEDGRLRKKEMKKLNDFMAEEYKKGNFVVAGGDWNQNPRGFEKDKIRTGDLVKNIDLPFGNDILYGWQFIFDPEMPTNRDVDMPYRKGKTKTTIIDFFVVSPNVTVESVKTIDTGFENADHQPVIIKIKIEP